MDDSRCIVDDGWQLHSLPGLFCGIRPQSPAERELRVRDVVRYLVFRSRGIVVSLLAAHARDGSDGSSIDSSP